MFTAGTISTRLTGLKVQLIFLTNNPYRDTRANMSSIDKLFNFVHKYVISIVFFIF